MEAVQTLENLEPADIIFLDQRPTARRFLLRLNRLLFVYHQK
jgi:hypothetical protein